MSAKETADIRIARQAEQLSSQLQRLRERMFPPAATKSLRSFSSGEVARLLGVSDSHLRQLSLDGIGPSPAVGGNGRRLYSLDQVRALRHVLSERNPKEAHRLLPSRRPGEKLQVLAVANFKGGSAKTTSTLYLAQYLALQGYRVLAVDLDPQASLSSLFGLQPEFDVGEGQTLYGAINYGETRRPLREIIRPTYFSGIDLVPANLELMEYEHETPRAIVAGTARGNDIFFRRVASAIQSVEAEYDVVVIDCPPQLGYLTLGALCAATSLVVTIHPQMVDVASMSQFLLMTADLLSIVRESGAVLDHDWTRYVITRHDPHDGPELQVVAMLRALFAEDVLNACAWKSTAIANAGLTRQTLYEIDRSMVGRTTYDRAIESMDAVNAEIEGLLRQTWGRA